MENKPTIIILPGNGGSDINKDHWYSWVAQQLRKLDFSVIAQNMPDPITAKKDIWLPHIKNEFHADSNTIIIGHSSGAVACLRYLEKNQLSGAIIIGANYTDLGDDMEKASGYFDKPWNWTQIKHHATWLVQFSSQDDPYIPISESRYIHQQLDSEYHEFTDRGHFGSENTQAKQFPELIEVILRKTNPTLAA